MSVRNRITDRELARLLSGRDEPSVLEKEALFERIMTRVAPVRQAKRWPWLGPSLAAAGAAAALVAVLVVRSDRGGEAEGSGEFLPRGNLGHSTAGHGGFELACVADGQPSSCQVGAKLTFWVSATPQTSHFASFGRRQDGAIVWYVPDPGGRSARVARATSPVLLDTAFVLDETHGAGTITVFGVFSAEPLSRAEIKSALGPDLRGDGSVSVVVRTLEVEAR
jgi:hypothetical protein